MPRKTTKWSGGRKSPRNRIQNNDSEDDSVHRKKKGGERMKNRQRSVIQGEKSFFVFKAAINFSCNFRVTCRLMFILRHCFTHFSKTVSWLNFNLLLAVLFCFFLKNFQVSIPLCLLSYSQKIFLLCAYMSYLL